MVKIPHQGRAGKTGRHLLGRAAHVDVDDVGTSGRSQPGALRHPVRLASCQLNRQRLDFAGTGSPAQDIRPLADQCIACDHLRNDQPCAKPVRHAAKRQIGHASHRREQNRICQNVTAN